jgi:excisionase family DNA binding protein
VANSLTGIADAARTLGVSTYTIRRLVAAGDLRAVHVGARVLIPVAEIERTVAGGVGTRRSRRLKRNAEARHRRS